MENVKLSKHSPHLRLRGICRSLRDAVDVHQPLWKYLRIDWSEPSALEISKLWFRNRRKPGIHVSVVPYAFYSENGWDLQNLPPPPDPALLELLLQHATRIKSATFCAPDGINSFLAVARVLQPHAKRLQYASLRSCLASGGACVTTHRFQNNGRHVQLFSSHFDGCENLLKGPPSLASRVKSEIRPLLARVVQRLRLPVHVKIKKISDNHTFREPFFPIRWDILSNLEINQSSDSLTILHDVLARDSAYAALETIELGIFASGPSHPDRIINQDLPICLPSLRRLSIGVRFGAFDADMPDDNQIRAKDFIGTFRCPALEHVEISSNCFGNVSGPMSQVVDLGKLLCLGQDTSVPLKTLRIDADFDVVDLYKVLDQAANLLYLGVTSAQTEDLERVLHALTWEMGTRRCPNLGNFDLVADAASCSAQQLAELSSLFQEVARSRLGGRYSESEYVYPDATDDLAEEEPYDWISMHLFTGSCGQQFQVAQVMRKW
ncbi:hypothetical protein HYDPIDRAFT_118268 [Hydnomerulius pinastri MD-312]|uniref:Uncharacterized protein n=1 Tax=Hydnomerulius pinastri MD-312 TaxID=994086 RepID=A0A0C9V304_9AGAM|nr:hypothetical protein HYDPIDRAFT_118268 [Hydnomerulius pinastri MD-312]